MSAPPTAGPRRRRPDKPRPFGALLPAIAEAAHRAGAGRIGLIDVGCGAGLNLIVDRVAAAYDNGQLLGDPASPVRRTCGVIGGRRIPERPVPEVAARVGIDRSPLAVTTADGVRRLRENAAAQHAAGIETLDAEIALAATLPCVLLAGRPLEVLPDAFELLPDDVLPVVTTTWAVSTMTVEQRLQFFHLLDQAGSARPIAWVSVEGVGVAPGVPTMGDRHASGHSIVAVGLFDHRTHQLEAVGRCWSRGRLLAWLADT